MCMNEYAATVIVRQRLDEARASAEREVLFHSLRTPWRVTVGQALVRLGERLAAGAPGRALPSLG